MTHCSIGSAHEPLDSIVNLSECVSGVVGSSNETDIGYFFHVVCITDASNVDHKSFPSGVRALGDYVEE